MAEPLRQQQRLQFLGRCRHVPEPLAERDDRDPVADELGGDLARVPAIDGDFPELVAFHQLVDTKLRDLGNERRRLLNRLEELETAPYEPIDAEVVLREGLASLRDLPRLLESGSLEERKEFVQAFVGGVKVMPEEARLELEMRKFPAVALPRPGNSPCELVAGARYERVQIEMTPDSRFVVQRKPIRLVA